MQVNYANTGGLLLYSKEVVLDASLLAKMREKVSKNELKSVLAYSRKVTVTRIRYRSNGHEVVGFIVEPRRVRGKLPCIIYNRGGNRAFGALNIFYLFTFLGMMASWGYIVIASQYSGGPGSEGEDEFGGSDLGDVLALKKILVRHPHADAERIGMFGASRGGMMTYLVLAKTRWLKAAVTVAAIADFSRQAKLRPEMRKEFRETFGGSVAEMKKRSAVCWPEKFSKKTPLLMMHGTADWRVSPLDSLDLSAALLKQGIHHRLVMFENDDHYLTAHRKEKWAMTREWFDRFVKVAI